MDVLITYNYEGEKERQKIRLGGVDLVSYANLMSLFRRLDPQLKIRVNGKEL